MEEVKKGYYIISVLYCKNRGREGTDKLGLVFLKDFVVFLKKEVKRPEIRVKNRNRLAEFFVELFSTSNTCSLTVSVFNEQVVRLLLKFKVVFGCLKLSTCEKESKEIIFCIEQDPITMKNKDSIITAALLVL